MICFFLPWYQSLNAPTNFVSGFRRSQDDVRCLALYNTFVFQFSINFPFFLLCVDNFFNFSFSLFQIDELVQFFFLYFIYVSNCMEIFIIFAYHTTSVHELEIFNVRNLFGRVLIVKKMANVSANELIWSGSWIKLHVYTDVL